MIAAVLYRVILQTALRSLLSVALYCCFFSLDKFTRELHLHGLFFRTVRHGNAKRYISLKISSRALYGLICFYKP